MDSWMALFHFVFGKVGVELLSYLGLVMLLDIVTGFIKSFKLKNFKSSLNFFGILKKLSLFVVIILANAIDFLLGTNGAITVTTTTLLIINEIFSCIENLSLAGVYVPNFLKDKLGVLQEKQQEKANKDTDKSKND